MIRTLQAQRPIPCLSIQAYAKENAVMWFSQYRSGIKMLFNQHGNYRGRSGGSFLLIGTNPQLGQKPCVHTVVRVIGLLTEKVASGGDTFLTTGFNNWKKETEYFLQHEKSVIPRESVLKLELMKQPTITVQLSSQAKTEQKENRDVLLKQLSSLRYLARQGLAIRGHSENEGNLMQLLLLRCEDNPQLKQWLVAKKYLLHDILNRSA